MKLEDVSDSNTHYIQYVLSAVSDQTSTISLPDLSGILLMAVGTYHL